MAYRFLTVQCETLDPVDRVRVCIRKCGYFSIIAVSIQHGQAQNAH